MGIGPMPRYPTNGRFMRENDSRSGGGLDEMTRRKLEITGLQTNRTSRVWSNSRFRRRALAAVS
jgi:hypothetical protein